MISLNDNELLNEFRFMKQLFKEVCEFLDSMILCSNKPVTEADLIWIVNCISDFMHLDSISEQCALYHALRTKYTSAMYGYSIQQVFIDEPCMIDDPPGPKMRAIGDYANVSYTLGFADNREFRRHGMNYAKETSYKKPNRRRPWE